MLNIAPTKQKVIVYSWVLTHWDELRTDRWKEVGEGSAEYTRGWHFNQSQDHRFLWDITILTTLVINVNDVGWNKLCISWQWIP